MRPSKQRILAGALTIAAVLVLGACGGDDPGESAPAATPDDAGDAEVAPVEGTDAVSAVGAVDGPLISVLSFEQGFVTLDPGTGDARPIDLDGVGFTDREQPALVAGDTAWVLGYTPVADQSFTNEVALAAVDLSAGTGGVVVQLGRDRVDDDNPDSVAWSVVGVVDDTVWVTERVFADTGFDLVGHDTATGAERARHRFDGDAVPRHLVVVGDAMLAQVGGDIVRVDLGTGAVEVVVSFFDSVALGDLIAPEELTAYVVTADGAPPEPGDVDAILRLGEPTPNAGWVTDGTSLWWVFDGFRTLDRGVVAVYGGVVRFDPATAAFTGAWPLGERYATFIDETTSTTMAQAELLVRDGVVWLADVRDDGVVLRLDPATGEVIGTAPGRDDDIDYIRLEMIETDPDAVWVRVTRFVITSTDEEGTSASGTSTIERIDPETGAAVVTVAETDIG
ncbi:MAG: hypothetical protein ACE367_21785 [Acidimicrobiales bacterium]